LELDDATEPLDIVGVFAPLAMSIADATMTMGNAVCQRSGGVITSCSLDAASPPAVYDPVNYASSGQCVSGSAVAAPCFWTMPEDMALLLLGIQFGMIDAVTYGGFTKPGFKTVEQGYIEGFLPKAVAMTIGINLPTGLITFDKLLAKQPLEKKNGIPGWTLTLEFHGVKVPYAP
jgi:hypothetical protein